MNTEKIEKLKKEIEEWKASNEHPDQNYYDERNEFFLKLNEKFVNNNFDISLSEYANINEHPNDYFLYWLEAGTHKYGSAKPGTSNMLGLRFERNNKKYVYFDNDYTDKNVANHIISDEKAKDIFDNNIKPFFQEIIRLVDDNKFENIEKARMEKISFFRSKQFILKFCQIISFEKVLPIFSDKIFNKIIDEYNFNITNKKNYYLTNFEIAQKLKEILPETDLMIAARFFWNKYNNKTINKDKLEKAFEEFKQIVYEKTNDSFTSFRNDKFVNKEENYKYKIRKEAISALNLETWEESQIGDGKILELVKKALSVKNNNLVNWYKIDDFKKIENNETLEQGLFELFKSEKSDNKKVFNTLKKNGLSYQFIAFLFFIKDSENYFPLSQHKFDEIFKKLNIDFKTTGKGNRTWSNYYNYNQIIKKIFSFLKTKIEDAEPLDAHSFLWIWGNSNKDTNYWIFQGNPDIYNFETALKENLLNDWTVTAHINKIKKGDKVIIWITGKNSGCYALAEVTHKPKIKAISDDDHLWKEKDKNETKADIKITHNLFSNPITKEQIQNINKLSKLKVGNQGTNFSATEKEYKTLLNLVEPNNKGIKIMPENIIKSIELLEKKKQIILYGPAGTGKTFSVKDIVKEFCDENYAILKKEGRLKFLTFHQSYAYEEFIEGIRAETKEEKVSYFIKSGIFKKLCKKAKENNDKNYFLIIDEINRGNISKIFGELITLLEKDKRLGEENEIIAELPYSNEPFGIPPNVYIIGTMNTSDKSIAQLDLALRRRFGFLEMLPNSELLSENIDGINLRKLLESLNNRIEVLLDKDHTIGHSYFMQVKNIEDLKFVFYNEIIPLLEEYFYGDYEKLQLVLGKEFVKSVKIDKSLFESNDVIDETDTTFKIKKDNFEKAINTIVNGKSKE